MTPTPLADYTLEKELGRGAMGVVYLARHRPTGTLRAVKMLHSSTDERRLARFRREAEALARVKGDCVVPVHEAGFEKGRAFLVMAHMPGGSLRDRLKTKGRLDWREAVALGVSIARALERCHAAGLVHRDLKPDNVLFDEAGAPRLADFGIARDLTAEPLTQTGTAVGTPDYMAPEQLAGQKVDHLADVYALGVVLHEAISGSMPFPGDSVLEVLAAKSRGARAPIGPGVPPAIDAVIERALAPEPEARTPSAEELAQDLEAALDGTMPRPARRRRRRGPLGVLFALAAALVVVGALAALGVALRAPPPPPDDRPPVPGPVAPLTSTTDLSAARRYVAEAESILGSREPLARAAERIERARAASGGALSADAIAALVSRAEVRVVRLCEYTRDPSSEQALEAAHGEILQVVELVRSLGAKPRLPARAGSIILRVVKTRYPTPKRRAAPEILDGAALAMEAGDGALAVETMTLLMAHRPWRGDQATRVLELLDRGAAAAPTGPERAALLRAKGLLYREGERWNAMLKAGIASLREDSSDEARSLVGRALLGVRKDAALSPELLDALVAAAPDSTAILFAVSLHDPRRASETVRTYRDAFGEADARRWVQTEITPDNLVTLVTRLFEAGRPGDVADFLQGNPKRPVKTLANKARNATSSKAQAMFVEKLVEALAAEK